MPGSKHLDWTEVRDFKPGLWTASDFLMPGEASAVMTNCRPDLGGGLRAASLLESLSTSGLTIATDKVCGLYVRGTGALVTPGVGQPRDRYIWLWRESDNIVRVYRMHEAAGATTWSLIQTHATGGAFAGIRQPFQVVPETFQDSSGVNHVIWNLQQGGSTDNGLWSINTSTGTVTRRTTETVHSFTVQDDRIVYAIEDTIKWSDSQSFTFPAANNLPIQASRQNNTIFVIYPTPPATLLVGTQASVWTQVQGDITNPFIYGMSDRRTPGWTQRMVQCGAGLAFIADRQGVVTTVDGGAFNDLSQQLDPTLFVREDVGVLLGGTSLNGERGGGTLAYVNNMLLAPHGKMYDERVQSWYQIDQLDDPLQDHFLSCADTTSREFMVAQGGTSFELYTFDAREELRAGSIQYKTPPLRHPSGRRLRMREVELYIKSHHADSTAVITVNDHAHTYDLSSGLQLVRAVFNEELNELDVRVALHSNVNDIEAPQLEVIRLGTQDGHLSRVV